MKRISNKINLLKRSGVANGMAYLLLSPEYYEQAKKEVEGEIVIEYDSLNHIEFFIWDTIKVGKHQDVKGNYLMPSICRTKQH